MEIKTSDLYCASYLLSEDGELIEVIVTSHDGRPRAEFVFTGDNIQELEKAFHRVKGSDEICNFISSLGRIKDLMFHALRKHELGKIIKSNLTTFHDGAATTRISLL